MSAALRTMGDLLARYVTPPPSPAPRADDVAQAPKKVPARAGEALPIRRTDHAAGYDLAVSGQRAVRVLRTPAGWTVHNTGADHTSQVLSRATADALASRVARLLAAQ